MNRNGLETFHVSRPMILRSILFLDLSENNLHVGSFPLLLRLPSLQGLDIHGNLYDKYPETFISPITTLQLIIVDIFEGFGFGNGFLSLRNLQRLEFHPRAGNVFPLRNNSFSGLQNIKITHLDIQLRGSVSDIDVNVLSPFRRVKELSLSIGRFVGIRKVLKALYGLRGKSMESLDLSTNYLDPERIITLKDCDIKYLSTRCVKRFYLTSCSISSIPYSISNSRFAGCLEEVHIGYYKFQEIDFLPEVAMLSYMGSRFNINLFK